MTIDTEVKHVCHSSSKLDFMNMSTSVLPTLTQTIVAKGDSAATSHYWQSQDAECLRGVRPYSGPSVALPDTDIIEPTQQGIVSLSNKLPTQAQTATTLPALTSSSLVSLGQLCDDNYTVVLNKIKLYAIKEDKVLLQGNRNFDDGL